MATTAYVPPVNQTSAPMQFDGNVGVGAVSLSSQLTAPSASPSASALDAWTFPLWLATGTGSAATTGGRLYAATLNLPAGTQISNIYFSIATGASGATTGQNFAGLYNAAGTLVAQTGDLTTVISTTTGFKTGPLTTPYVTTTSGTHYVAMYFNAATTLPVLTCMANQVTLTTSATLLAGPATVAAASYPFAVAGAGGYTTALPATITPSSNSLTNAFVLWAAVG